MKKKPVKIQFTTEEFNTLINGMIFKFGVHCEIPIEKLYPLMESFYQKFQKETNFNEKSVQFGQDDQREKESV